MLGTPYSTLSEQFNDILELDSNSFKVVKAITTRQEIKLNI